MRGKFSQASGCLSLLCLLTGWRCYVCGKRRWRLDRAYVDGRYRDVCGECRVHIELRQTDPRAVQTMSTTDTLFAELISAHGEENGGIEDFRLLDASTIACRYGDTVLTLRSGGWHYGSNATSYPTPKEAFEQRMR